MKKNYETILKLIIILTIFILIITNESSPRTKCETHSDCLDDEICFDDGSYLHLKYCYKFEGFWKHNKGELEEDLK